VVQVKTPAYIEIDKCRLCKGSDLRIVLNLGESCLTGVFPMPNETVPLAPLVMVWCSECHLTQLKHSNNPDEMYGDNYGYRSGLNASMVRHLQQKARILEKQAKLSAEDVVLDIGCNDGTLLAGYSTDGLVRIGIDPTAGKFSQWHEPGLLISSNFFSSAAFWELSKKPAKVITSIAMFYDLEDPVQFAKEIRDCLADDGIWHFEQSYMPSMLRSGSYDTVCHEHLEYYSLENVMQIADRAGLRVITVRFNSTNGGSFAVSACKKEAKFESETPLIGWLLSQEKNLGIDTLEPFLAFEKRVKQHRLDLINLMKTLHEAGQSVYGYGASTKGNVMLQYCGIDTSLMPEVADVNPEKYGRTTPGTQIPIVSEENVKSHNPDYMLVLPWHFRETIISREAKFLENGGRLIFPLPEIEIVGD
jgi:hypothetical protein